MFSLRLARKVPATTSSQVASSAICSPDKDEAEHHLHMAWAVIADKNGNPRPRMHWLVD